MYLCECVFLRMGDFGTRQIQISLLKEIIFDFHKRILWKRFHPCILRGAWM